MNRLYRSRRDRVLLGVCGGIAHYLRVDPVIVRVIWVLVALSPFPGIIAYLVAALLMPEEPRPAEPGRPGGPRPEGAAAERGAPGAATTGGQQEMHDEGGMPGTAPREGEALAGDGQRERTIKLLGWGLVAVGAVVLAYNWAVMTGPGRLLRTYVPIFNWHFWTGLSASWWPLVLIVLGAIVLWRGVRRSG